jgi:hypothetical protein
MPAPPTNDRSTNDDGTPPTRSPVDIGDPLVELDTIRTLLHGAIARLGRLAAAIKQHRRQARVVQAAVNSLQKIPQLPP